MKIPSLLSVCMISLSVNAASFTEIPDKSSLVFLNPDLEMRQVVKLRLSNQLDVLLISDPQADLSAASLAVESGSWDDPVEYPGMAHFCEHMLFMGSEKYPDENAFSSLLSNYAGTSNAFTADDRTVYMFSARKEGFLSLLDRFAHFYIDPLFNTASISRELHAVDQEFAKNIQNDGWRIHMIWKETGNPEHPHRMFSIGNSETLSHIPQSALKKWHRENYGANRMHLAIYSSLPINTLKQSVEESFSAIAQIEEKTQRDVPLFSSRQKGHITYIKPFQNLQALILRWEIPFDLAEDPSHPGQLLSFALAKAQKHNLEQLLKSEQWIDHISISAEGPGPNRNRFFEMRLYLTQKGMEQIPTVALRCFQALAGIQQEGIPPYLFEEKNQLAQLHYQYQTREDAFSYIRSVGETLTDEPLETYPRAQLIASQYEPQKIAKLLDVLKPEDCAVTIVGSSEQTQIIPDRKERWLGAEYAIRPIPPNFLEIWNQAKPHPEIAIAEPNPFIPAHLHTVSSEASHEAPQIIADTDFGSAYYARCPEFLSPEICHTFHILTPSIGSDCKSQVLSLLFLDHITDQLNPTLAAAANAGLNTRMSIERSEFQFQIAGFSEKAPLLLGEIIRNLTLHPPTKKEFDLYFERHEKAFSNAAKELACRQAKELLDSLIKTDKPTSKEKLKALRSICYEDFVDFCKTLFDKVYLKATFNGNLTEKEAFLCWLDALHVLGKSAFAKDSHPENTSLRLAAEKGPYQMSEQVEVLGNASILLIDEGVFSFEKRGTQEILNLAIKEAFFQELRTKQKTGYIAFSDAQEVEGNLYQYFIVQSNTHQPEDLLYRFELFLENYLQNFATEISQERFETLRVSSIDSLKTRYRNLRAKAALWDLLAFQYQNDFAFIEKRIQALETLNYDDFATITRNFISRENRKRLSILFEGKVENPFSFQPLSFEQIKEIAEYSPRAKSNQSVSSR